MNRLITLAYGSLVVGIVVLGLKYAAYAVTGSIALYSDALESIINVAAAVAALVAVRLSAIPPDANHPYGHHKVEYLSAVLEGVLIVVAALAIVREAYLGYLSPRTLEDPGLGLAINGVASVINAAWSTVLIRQGRRFRSPALVADGRHLATDVMSSVGVLAGVGIATVTGWAILDPILAVLVAVNILWSGWVLVSHSIGGLMDAAAPPEELEKIRVVISKNADGAIEAHDVRTRHAGPVTFVDFHLVVDGSKTVSEAHDICDRIENALRDSIKGAVVTIHVEPEAKAKHTGIVVL
ncbi:cation diffusion facilitator family transporter [Chthonobacter rhizosphaerae]|uniref:cation diffusion facilitator family transporter n=1 Tax=Chthonobacter rhizosphaerae TaxID=2735553 RepID=UPI0015EE863D|nr:cation diffusion facilitator family transporter [Chthonobacter rhizosphaerae]